MNAPYRQKDSLWSSGFDPSKPTKILVYGIRGKHTGSFPTNLRDAYLNTNPKNDYNVLGLDWKTLAVPDPELFFKATSYPGAVKKVKIVAGRLAAFISWLNEDFDVSLDQVHLIGHSLGFMLLGMLDTR